MKRENSEWSEKFVGMIIFVNRYPQQEVNIRESSELKGWRVYVVLR